MSQGSLVSVMSSMDWLIRVWSLAGAKDFSSSLCIQTSSGVHFASYAMGIGGVLSWEVKCGRGMTLTTHPHLVPSSGMSRTYTSSPPVTFIACSRTALLYFTLFYFILLYFTLLIYLDFRVEWQWCWLTQLDLGTKRGHHVISMCRLQATTAQGLGSNLWLTRVWRQVPGR
jgi:hypothetical protein